VIVRVTRSPVRLGDITVANAPQAEAAAQPVEAPVHARAPVIAASTQQQPPRAPAPQPISQQQEPSRAPVPQANAPVRAATAAPLPQCGIGLVLSTIAGGNVQVVASSSVA
jgi:hypothetical protein